MSIKSITIENFKGISEPVKFDLAPIVLLYGPNSAGKSTLLQALAYLNDVIVHDECNNEYTRAGGESMYLGNYADTVNGHDVSKSIRFAFEINDIPNWYSIIKQIDPAEEYDFGNFKPFVELIRESRKKSERTLSKKLIADGLMVEFTIDWDSLKKSAFLSGCRFAAQSNELMDITTNGAGGSSTIKFNFDHPSYVIKGSRYVHIPSLLQKYNWSSLFDCIIIGNSLLMNPQTQIIGFKDKGIFEWSSEASHMPYRTYPNHMRGFLAQLIKVERDAQRHGINDPVFKGAPKKTVNFGDEKWTNKNENEDLADVSETNSESMDEWWHLNADELNKINEEANIIRQPINEIPRSSTT